MAPSDLDDAFKAILRHEDRDSTSIGSAALLQLLQEHGEAMTEDEIARCLSELLGDGAITTLLPQRIDGTVFAEDIAGFQ